eukprot:12664817-Prorocentrum_lima.AAC.1
MQSPPQPIPQPCMNLPNSHPHTLAQLYSHLRNNGLGPPLRPLSPAPGVQSMKEQIEVTERATYP